MRAVEYLPIAVMLFLVNGAHAGNQRVLFENPDYEMTLAEDYYCGEPATVTVHSARPEMFESDSPELQRIVDATQAVLAFECPEVNVVRVEGRLAGLDEPVYAGVSERASRWELIARRSIQSEEYQEYEALVNDEYASIDEGLGFTVANLSAGMSVDEARAVVAETFGVEPEYDVENGVLTMQAGGCPADYDWAALSPTPDLGWKCLEAWFTDQRQARMYLLDLIQVIEAEEPEAVKQHLIDRFGEPVYRDTREHDRGWWKGDGTIHMMAWGEVVESGDASSAGEQTDIYTLQAKVLPIDDVTIVTVTLYEPDLRPRWASDSDSKVPDLTL